MVRLSLLWEAPEVNPINHKARAIPVLNVVNPYGRVFFFGKSWETSTESTRTLIFA